MGSFLASGNGLWQQYDITMNHPIPSTPSEDFTTPDVFLELTSNSRETEKSDQKRSLKGE